jgi:hypothetical protein
MSLTMINSQKRIRGNYPNEEQRRNLEMKKKQETHKIHTGKGPHTVLVSKGEEEENDATETR